MVAMNDQRRIRVIHWGGAHENAQSRKVKGPLPWVRVPVAQKSGYALLTAKHGFYGLGVWLAILHQAANRDRDERGYTYADPTTIAVVARCQSATSDATSQVLDTLEHECGWIAREPARNGCDTTPLPVHSQSDGSVVGRILSSTLPSSSSELKEDESRFGSHEPPDGLTELSQMRQMFEARMMTPRWCRGDAEEDEARLLRLIRDKGGEQVVAAFGRWLGVDHGRGSRTPQLWQFCKWFDEQGESREDQESWEGVF